MAYLDFTSGSRALELTAKVDLQKLQKHLLLQKLHHGETGIFIFLDKSSFSLAISNRSPLSPVREIDKKTYWESVWVLEKAGWVDALSFCL